MVQCRIWDNIVVKRKVKTKYNRRKVASRESYDRVLIVCEGITEQYYFKGLIRQLKLSTANVEISNPKQNTPDSLLKEAKRLYRKSKYEKNIFDRVYCLFDKDRHPKYKETKGNIKQIKNTYFAAYSEPCFEYFLLLHFIYTTKTFTKFDELRKDKDFKKYFPKYNKTDKGIFIKLQGKIGFACKNAKNNPHTNLDKLVQYLQKIK